MNALKKSPTAVAKEVILDEAKALQEIASSLDDSFEKATELIGNMKEVGRVIIGGMGKSGFIGMKISATLASIGIPSFSMHPAEAVHGDLGRFTKNDIALLLSNSGETQEIVELIPFLKRVGCPLIALTADADSTLGRNSNIVLRLGKHREAGPLGLAPTTSTTAMLALGDALAMALMEYKGFSKEDFAGFHPAGSLGRSLLSVAEIMRKGEELCIVPLETFCKDVLERITNTRGRPGAAVVIDEQGTLAGIFTDGDLRRCLNSGEGFLMQPVREHMGKNPKAVSLNTLVREATDLMNSKRVDQLIVIDDERKPVGLVDIQDAVSVRMR
ncbi:MAG: KpsF/GutQ family sugar-phosphate isomerase [Bdellovibrionales bacterium]|nr:KpsF/GutQ family sugar-phosphate isomerase [Bdellovibrionales bacterium]